MTVAKPKQRRDGTDGVSSSAMSITAPPTAASRGERREPASGDQREHPRQEVPEEVRLKGRPPDPLPPSTPRRPAIPARALPLRQSVATQDLDDGRDVVLLRKLAEARLQLGAHAPAIPSTRAACSGGAKSQVAPCGAPDGSVSGTGPSPSRRYTA
jgi:hypothetical protein